MCALINSSGLIPFDDSKHFDWRFRNLNCCPDVTNSFYLGSGVYPCSTHLTFPAVTAHALFKYCPSSSMMQSENLPTMNNRNNGEQVLNFDILLLLFASVTGIMI
jgi:hypothetical protein